MRTSFERKRLWRFSQILKTKRIVAKKAIKERVIDVQITLVSNYKKLKSDTCNSTPT